jgi:hypothetical protein
VFVQAGRATGRVDGGISPLACGDVVTLRSGETLATDAPLDLVAFAVPEALPEDVPTFVRPDRDPRIADSPGGCATDSGAYRRVLLTWLGKNGPYLFHGLNCHRVRMTDSFSHYHPRERGFDELYLVQGVEPGARLYTSTRVETIERPDEVRAEDVADLVDVVEPEIGDLIYVGRGEMHRAVGGVLAQVITVPGFVPGCEIGVDHHLRAISERLGLRGARALPFNVEASEGPVVK